MTKDEIIVAAKEVGAYRYINRAAKDEPTHTFTVEQLERFAAIIVKAEREDCAKVCECQQDKTVSGGASGNYWKRRATPQDCADAIRARGDSK